jgi:hypothetical protein
MIIIVSLINFAISKTNISIEYIYIYIYKPGTVKIPNLLKHSLHEPLGLSLNITIIALFWATHKTFHNGERTPKYNTDNKKSRPFKELVH